MKIAELLIHHNGNVRRTAREIGVSRWALYSRIKQDSELQQILVDSREGMKDEAESSLEEAVRDGQSWAVMFTLKLLGRDRGYFESSNEYIMDRLEKLEAKYSERIGGNPESAVGVVGSGGVAAIGTGDV